MMAIVWHDLPPWASLTRFSFIKLENYESKFSIDDDFGPIEDLNLYLVVFITVSVPRHNVLPHKAHAER